MTDAGLEIDRIAKRYGAVLALRELSVTVPAGELCALVGGRGAGKTTALRIALGVLPADAGRVRWHSAPITPAVRRKIGYLPSERGLYPTMKLLDHLVYLGELHGLPVNTAHRRAENWIERLELRPHRTDTVDRLDPELQRRTRLAAALVHEPEILLLDEPFAALGSTTAELLGEVLRERAALGGSVLLSSRELDVAERWCDRVALVHSGSLVAGGRIEELREAAPVRLVVDAPQAAEGWTDGVPGCRVRSVEGNRWLLELDEGVDEQTVLRAALSTGPVREFGRRRPSLTELFEDREQRAAPSVSASVPWSAR